MGGNAFTHPPYELYIPRIPTPLYHQLVEKFREIISSSFQSQPSARSHPRHGLSNTSLSHATSDGSGGDGDGASASISSVSGGSGSGGIKVATPLPGPGKKDHGDLDFVVSFDFTSADGEWVQRLSKVLGATAAIRSGHGAGAGASFAVPFTVEECAALATLSPPQTHPQPKSKTHPHIQLDITLVPPDLYTWHLFQQSHSDLWNLLGTTIRPFGLTANDRGLHLRIPEIEHFDRKRSLVELTRDPVETLEFLGYGRDRDGKDGEEGKGEVERVLEREFGCVEEMYGFVARGRFFRRENFGGLDYENGESEGGGVGRKEKEGEREGGKREGKASDRKRMLKREGYRRFVCEFVPALLPVRSRTPASAEGFSGLVTTGEQEGEGGVVLTREMVREEALGRFGKRTEYESRLKEWKMEREMLARRQEGREERKREAEESEFYFRGWRGWLRGNEDALAGGGGRIEKREGEGG